ncbi:MAG: glycosyl transferase [Thermodesulfobacteriota bacterium]|nr:MAG: glycosyl transferase [Thermodesulfobacteriota bacterium]
MTFPQNTKNRVGRFYADYGKRAFDLAISVPLLIVLFPLFLLISLLIKLGSEGPVFFTQERIGKEGKVFKLYKFRTMIKDAHSKGPSVTSRGDKRITPLGKLLRRYKLDELPQLLNVVMGEMSLVGPRPEVKKYVDAFQDDYSSILKVRPGITDYAALRYRSEEGILAGYDNPEQAYTEVVLPEKITLYKKYIREMGVMADVQILFMTLREVIKC